MQNQVQDLIAKKVKQSFKKNADHEISPERKDDLATYNSPMKDSKIKSDKQFYNPKPFPKLRAN